MNTIHQEKTWLLQEKYNGEETEGYRRDVERLLAGEPLAYIIGHVPFMHTKIYLDSKPLIPRPETEFWVGLVLEEVQDAFGKLDTVRVLDMCAGSGCIGVAALDVFSKAEVDFVEIDEKHHDTIRKNIRENGFDNRETRVFGGNLFDLLSSRDMYHLILSNPPYIDVSLGRIEEGVRKHEPWIALDGGRGGLEMLIKIVIEAKKHLLQNGILVCEHEPEQMDEMRRMAEECGFVHEEMQDQYGVARISKFRHVSVN